MNYPNKEVKFDAYTCWKEVSKTLIEIITIEANFFLIFSWVKSVSVKKSFRGIMLRLLRELLEEVNTESNANNFLKFYPKIFIIATAIYRCIFSPTHGISYRRHFRINTYIHQNDNQGPVSSP